MENAGGGFSGQAHQARVSSKKGIDGFCGLLGLDAANVHAKAKNFKTVEKAVWKG